MLAVILAGWILGAGSTLRPPIQDHSDAVGSLTPLVPLALGLLLHNIVIPILAFVSAFVASPWFEKKARRRRSTARRAS